MLRKRSMWLAVLTGSCLPLAQTSRAQDRMVPHAETQVFTGPELAESERRLEALEKTVERLEEELERAKAAALDTREVDEIETRLTEARAAVENHQMLAPDDPIRPFLPDLLDKLDELDALVPDRFGPTPLSADQARKLDELLFFDFGPPRINYRWQDAVLGSMQESTTHPDISTDACKILRDTLLEYERGGGGRASPSLMEELAEALYRASEPGDREARDTAVRLHHEALDWCSSLQQDDSHSLYTRIFDRLVQTSRELQDVSPRVNESQLAGDLGEPREAGRHPSGARRAWAAKKEIQRHLRRFNWDPSKLDRITALGLADYGHAALNEDMTSMLLVAYRRILLKPRAAVSKQTVRRIDAHLLKLAQEPGRLVLEKHWTLWGRATAALGHRASRDIRRFIWDHKKRERDRVKKRALEYAWRGLQRKQRHEVPPMKAQNTMGSAIERS